MTLNDLNFSLHTFNELSRADLYEVLKLRNEVFVLEQDCPYLDLDGLDQDALHLYKKTDTGEVVAYARILTPAQNNHEFSSIGRVVVSQKARHEKLGGTLMQAAIKATINQFPEHTLKISAQTYLHQFYLNLGFVSTGSYYLEDQIPHQEMHYRPK